MGCGGSKGASPVEVPGKLQTRAPPAAEDIAVKAVKEAAQSPKLPEVPAELTRPAEPATSS